MNVGDASELIGRESLLRAIVTLTGRRDVKLCDDVEVKRATSGFEGFLSIVLRAKVSYRVDGDPAVRRKSFFVKCLPKEKMQLDVVKVTNVFAREGTYYDKALPIIEEVAAGKLDVPLPKCYHAVYGSSEDVICLEDLAETGYETVERRYLSDGMDWDHCIIYAKKLGTLHALGLAAERRLPSEKKNWIEAFPVLGEEPLYYLQNPEEPPIPFKGVADTGNEIVLEVARELPGLPKEAEASGKLKEILERFWPVISELVKPHPGGRNVLSHGDSWVNNVMFRYEVDGKGAKKPWDLKFIDLQMAKYRHPSVDLLFFIQLSTRRDFREKYYDDVIREYYSSLQDSLKSLDFGPPPFSMEEFQSDLKNVYRPFGVYFGAVYTPCMLLEEDFVPTDADDMTPEKYHDLLNSGNVLAIRRRLANDPVYRSKVEDVVREFVEMVFPNGSVESSPFLK